MQCKHCLEQTSYSDLLCRACYWQAIATLCDLVLGENADKRDDETLIQAVAMLQSAATTNRK